MKARRSKVFWSGRSQAVRIPREFRFDTDTVLVRRRGKAVVIEPVDEWPEGWVDSFSRIPCDFERPPQGEVERREALS
jgi:antitoxin VapB